MVVRVTSKYVKDARRYRYYVCRGAQQKGYDSCPAPSIPAGEPERFVIDEIRCIGEDDALAREVFARTQHSRQQRLDNLQREAASLRDFQRLHHSELEQLAKQPETSNQTDLVADVQSRITRSQSRLIEIDEEIERIRTTESSLGEVREALTEFDDVWESTPLQERARMIELLIERVDYDGAAGKIKITFHPTGITSIGEALAVPQETTT